MEPNYNDSRLIFEYVERLLRDMVQGKIAWNPEEMQHARRCLREFRKIRLDLLGQAPPTRKPR